jgi:hypothetical protein
LVGRWLDFFAADAERIEEGAFLPIADLAEAPVFFVAPPVLFLTVLILEGALFFTVPIFEEALFLAAATPVLKGAFFFTIAVLGEVFFLVAATPVLEGAFFFTVAVLEEVLFLAAVIPVFEETFFLDERPTTEVVFFAAPVVLLLVTAVFGAELFFPELVAEAVVFLVVGAATDFFVDVIDRLLVRFPNFAFGFKEQLEERFFKEHSPVAFALLAPEERCEVEPD